MNYYVLSHMYSSEEEPLYPESGINEIFQKHKPQPVPRKSSPDHTAVLEFANKVTVIIQSCNKNEYYAALEKIEPPAGLGFETAVRYPDLSMTITLGTFAECNAAIAWTEQGEACERDLRKILGYFPNTKALLGLGVAFGMDRKTVRFCDVLVAQQVADYGERPRVEKGTITLRGQVLNTKENLENIFCQDSVGWSFPCTKEGRVAKAVVGQVISSPLLLDDEEFKKGIKIQCPNAKGGEMEGRVLYTRIQAEFPKVETIVIKGVADYADGKKDKRWQLTAAKAAVSYAYFQVEDDGAFLYDTDDGKTPVTTLPDIK